MAESTPFIDTLSTSDRARVERKSRGNSRPTYYDGTRAETQARVEATGREVTNETAQVLISLDLEAALILASTSDKKKMLDFLQASIAVVSNTNADDFELMGQVVQTRVASYQQVRSDVGQKVSDYETARQQFLGFIEAKAREGGASAADTTAIVIPDLNAMFTAITDAHTALSRPDLLMVHDRIADAGALYDVQDAATNRTKELSSWVGVIQKYLV